MPDNEITLTPEEAAALIAQFNEDFKAALPDVEPQGFAAQEQIQVDCAKHALALAVSRERAACAKRHAETVNQRIAELEEQLAAFKQNVTNLRKTDEKIMRHYAEAAINAHVRAERQSCIDVLQRAIGDRRITDWIVEEMQSQAYPVNVQPTDEVLAERERCASIGESHFSRCQTDAGIVGVARYNVAITMLSRLIEQIRSGK